MVRGQNRRPRRAPTPRWSPPSRFVTECLASIRPEQNDFAADFGAGYGRNALAAAVCGWNTVAIDLDRVALASLMKHYALHKDYLNATVSAMCADLSKDLPIGVSSLALGMVIEYSPDIELLSIASCVQERGHLILETFGNRGENWRRLPRPGEIEALLGGEFDILTYRESGCGESDDIRCTVKLFGRRIR